MNSDGSSANDFSASLPGTFNNTIPEQGVPGTAWKAYDNSTRKAAGGYGTDTTFQFQLYFWTGTETTYAQAVADGQYTAEASWLQTVNPASWLKCPTSPRTSTIRR